MVYTRSKNTFWALLLTAALAFGFISCGGVRDPAPPASAGEEALTQTGCAHEFGAWTTVKEATCGAPGTRARRCLLCGEGELETIPSPEHVPVERAGAAPDCLTAGRTAGQVCALCGGILVPQKEIPALGHGPLTVTGAAQPTDTENGYTGDRVCGRCGAVVEKGNEIPAKGHLHTELRGATEATCASEGYSGDWYCVDCGAIVARGSAIGRTEHRWIAQETRPPDCENEGYTLSVCAVCGAERKSGLLPALGHQPNDEGVCDRCGASVYDCSGDFGALHYDRFLPGRKSALTLEGNREIRAYAAAENLEIGGKEGEDYLCLYRSHDLFVSLRSFYDYSGVYLTKFLVYEVYIRNLANLYTVNRDRGGVAMSDLIAEGEKSAGGMVIAAVNGDYSSNSKVCRVCLRNGELIRNKSGVYCDVCVLYEDGTMTAQSAGAFDLDSARKKGIWQLWNFGPSLLDKDGDPRKTFPDGTYERRLIHDVHPRTAIGCAGSGHYFLVVADGRQEDENGVMLYGCTIPKLAQVMRSLGCTVAYNLDGGDSSQAYMNGRFVRIDKTRDPQRVLSDIVCIGEINEDR